MHRELLQVPAGKFTDHIDGDGLNNQRRNLRICTRAENQRNRRIYDDSVSGYKGISWHKRLGKWRATIKVDGIQISLGCFTSAKKAAHVYDDAAIKYYGEFARPNFLK